MDDADRVSDELHVRLRECTENLWVRRQTARDLVGAPGSTMLSEVTLSDEDIADACGFSLPVVRAWLDAEAGDDLAVGRSGDTRLVKALLGE